MNDFIQRFTKRNVVKDFVKLGPDYFIVSSFQKKLIEKDPFSLGLFLGKRTKRFKPSINLLNMISRYTINKVVVDKRQEWLFVCGRDLFRSKLLHIKGESPYKLVLNQNNEVLGYGMLKGKLFKNLFDIGDFLRRERD